MKTILLYFIFLFPVYTVLAQPGGGDGQNPESGFPVCGTTSFIQTTVPLVAGRTLVGPCNADIVTDINPYWYQFTCFKTGSFSFELIPNNLSDDYDWQLYDITNRNPEDVYIDGSMVVACNWSGRPGRTGASSAGKTLNNCGGDKYPQFSSMPTLEVNHTYLLLISHFTNTQSGYALSFGTDTKSTGNITDPLPPDLKSSYAACDGQRLYVILNKKMKSSSLAADGSDFSVSFPGVNIISAKAVSTNNFQMDTVLLTLDVPLPPNNYSLTMRKGSDLNTLLDNCNAAAPEAKSISVKVPARAPTFLKEYMPLACSPKKLELKFDKKILCNSIAADGSDFIITGPTPVTITGAKGNCNSGESDGITIQLSDAIIVAGTYQISTRTGTDGNIIINECGEATPENSFIKFMVKSPVFAAFTYDSTFDCKANIFQFEHDGDNEVSSWKWTIDGKELTTQNPKYIFTTFGEKLVKLTVSNGFCADSISKIFDLNNEVRADFETNNILCPEDSAAFLNKSVGDIISWEWNFDNGFSSPVKSPDYQKYPLIFSEKEYTVTLTAKSSNCTSTISQQIRVLKSCYIAVPTAFTPNQDNLNDYLYPLNAFKAKDLQFSVYNRWGKIVFSSTDWTKKWDGTINGEPQPVGSYTWTLKYTNIDTGKKFEQKGQTLLIR